MSIHVQGTIRRSQMGTGTWTLLSAEGQTYELHAGAPAALLKDGFKVNVNGTIREDVMTLAMVGPVLEVHHFEPMQ